MKWPDLPSKDGWCASADGEESALIRFRLDARTGVPAYRQLIDQVRQAIRLGVLRSGDRLPSVREVVKQIAINPNTVHRAYRELEMLGLAEGKPGLGTFVLDHDHASRTPPERAQELLGELRAWVEAARQAGLDDEGIRGLVNTSMNQAEWAQREHDKGLEQ
ncbi:MAG TPA: GntR family transcriptional regulator [Acidimicrobiales bacterium]|nr:GntR family transcriptional regulator [Acidimicrobiales bacterium]